MSDTDTQTNDPLKVLLEDTDWPAEVARLRAELHEANSRAEMAETYAEMYEFQRDRANAMEQIAMALAERFQHAAEDTRREIDTVLEGLVADHSSEAREGKSWARRGRQR